ncbi:histidine kinase (plasmid) [Rhizobium sp. CB3171]|uniref:histidine kinase n=1 Tax=unclassified Rhizobium TaxID=2613769 RepID=UPI0021A2A40C|nr:MULTISPECIES: histidine kinase [Rhizobium]UWU23622.1 histidine kinase [Rhizobium tropici]WFU04355.1 histidine kinase [Rhizobium sp. CB3171]
MKKTLLIAAAFAAAFPLLAHAETIQFPSDEPIAEVSIPHTWGPKETETGVDATSPDSAIYFSIDIASDKTIDKTLDDVIDFLSKNGVDIDAKSKHEFPDSVLNGMKMAHLEWDGKDKDGPVDVELGLLQPSEHKLLIVTYWGSKETQDKHDEAVQGIMNSLKPLND